MARTVLLEGLYAAMTVPAGRVDMRVRRVLLGWVTVACLVPASTVSADQLFGVNLGVFAVRAEDGRTNGDVLSENLTFLLFDLGDFKGATIGADWMLGLGPFLEAGVGTAFYRRTVPSVYDEFVNADGSEIEQDLKLRVVPVGASLRLFPFGRGRPIEPYVGGGLNVYSWRYSETGEFVDFGTLDIFRDSFVDKGTSVGPEGILGVRFGVTNSILLGGELRIRGGSADLDEALGFAGDRIDLGGLTTQLTFVYRF